MVLSLILALAWVLAATIVACLPLRLQRPPGLLLLLAAPVLIWLLYRDFGALAAAFGLFALGSMFRKPLCHLARSLRSAPDAGAPPR